MDPVTALVEVMRQSLSCKDDIVQRLSTVVAFPTNFYEENVEESTNDENGNRFTVLVFERGLWCPFDKVRRMMSVVRGTCQHSIFRRIHRDGH